MTLGSLFLLFVLAFAYFLPFLVAQHRGRDGLGLIFVCNLLFGWTVVGWVVLLVIGFTGASRKDRAKRDEELALLRTLVVQNDTTQAQRAAELGRGGGGA